MNNLKKNTINCKGQLVDINNPIVMGIVNITPDSFFDGGKYTERDSIVKKVEQIISEGGQIIDIGAYSSRPGAKSVSEKEESSRMFKALGYIRHKFPDLKVSVDTFRSEIAKKAVKDFEVCMINDISAGNMDTNMFETIAELGVPYIMMHMKGTPENMQNNPEYDNVMKEIFAFFTERIYKLKALGVNDIILDPGFGFGKTLDHNYEIINKLEEFKIFNLPLLVGLSRKSMIYKLLNSSANESLNGTTVLNTIAIHKGAKFIRVHDVKEAVETITIVSNLNNS